MFRLDEDVKIKFQIYLKRKGFTVQDYLEKHILNLLGHKKEKNNG